MRGAGTFGPIVGCGVPIDQLARLDVYVTSSGLLGPPSIAETTPADLYKLFEANSMAPFFALKYAPPAMAKTTPKGNYPNAAPKDQAYGSIVVVSSVASTYGGCWGPAFTMSSHAALGVVRAGVATLKGSAVRINCISPGQIDVGVDLKGFDLRGLSAQFPPSSLQSKKVQQEMVGLERSGRPLEVARAVGFLASGFSSYVTGTNMVVDGGASVMSKCVRTAQRDRHADVQHHHQIHLQFPYSLPNMTGSERFLGWQDHK